MFSPFDEFGIFPEKARMSPQEAVTKDTIGGGNGNGSGSPQNQALFARAPTPAHMPDCSAGCAMP